MAGLIGVAALAALLVWFVSPRRRPAPAPEDDIESPVDHDELAEAERDLREDARPRPLHDGMDEEDDWGPGTA